jgi:hypothetical protein
VSYQSNVRNQFVIQVWPRFLQLANFWRSAIRGGKDAQPGDGKDEASKINVQVGNLAIVETSPTSLTITALVNFTNPTKYSATVPYFNINILANGSHIGSATVRDMEVSPGNNTNKLASVLWDPYTYGGDKGKKIGAELLSQYISGTSTVVITTHPRTNPPQATTPP